MKNQSKRGEDIIYKRNILDRAHRIDGLEGHLKERAKDSHIDMLSVFSFDDKADKVAFYAFTNRDHPDPRRFITGETTYGVVIGQNYCERTYVEPSGDSSKTGRAIKLDEVEFRKDTVSIAFGRYDGIAGAHYDIQFVEFYRKNFKPLHDV